MRSLSTVPTLGLVLLLSGCMKEELPVPRAPRGDARSIQVCMGTGYRDQIWLDLASGEVVSTNVKTAWELAFESAPNGWRVMLNGSRLMTAWNIGVVPMEQPADTNGMAAARRIDAPSGHADSTAFGDWRGVDDVYILDLGYDALGLQLGFRKVHMRSVDATAYTFDVSRLDGSDLRSITLPKDPARTWTHFSLADGPVAIGPPRGDWDLVLTHYTHQFYEPFLPYLVVGALIDDPLVRVSRITNADFASVSLADTLQFPFGSMRNAIGYDWKDYSFDTSSYTCEPDLVFIVQDADGFFHKLRFLDFYSPQGQVGCPQIDLQTL
jgi:hypothetical protein